MPKQNDGYRTYVVQWAWDFPQWLNRPYIDAVRYATRSDIDYLSCDGYDLEYIEAKTKRDAIKHYRSDHPVNPKQRADNAREGILS